ISGTVFSARGGHNEPAGVAGITVQLKDAAGDVLATTVTDRNGHYTFNQLSGPSGNPGVASGVSATGSDEVVLALPAGLRPTSANPALVVITRGGTNATGVNFTVTSAGQPTSSWGQPGTTH